MPRELRDIHRALLLQACHRLKIPDDRWPVFTGGLMVRPEGYGHVSHEFPAFRLPIFEQNQESLMEWRSRAERLFREHCDIFMKMVDQQIEHQIKTGSLTRVVQPDEKASPLNLRYEWAARKYCFNEQYKSMASGKHSPETIRKAVSKILSEGEVGKRK
jgi:hypothetical protein